MLGFFTSESTSSVRRYSATSGTLETYIIEVKHCRRIEDLKSHIAKLQTELEVKDAIITEALSSYSSLPPHPSNYSLIETSLGISLKKKSFGDTPLQCTVNSTFICDDFLCVAAEVHNLSNFNAVVSGLLLSCSSISRGHSETTTVVFNGLNPVEFIKKGSERELLVSSPKGIILDDEPVLIIEFHLVDIDSSINMRMLQALPLNTSAHNVRSTFCFPIQRPVKFFDTDSMTDVTIKDGILLYQAIYALYVSREVNFRASQLSLTLRSMKTFEAVDFGDWQLIFGKTMSVHGGLVALCLFSNCYEMTTQSRIFARNILDLDRFECILRGLINPSNAVAE